MPERAIRLCDGLIEWGWLAAIVAVPAYFNTADVRAFEPDKAILVRDLAAVLGVLSLLRLALSLRVPSAATPTYLSDPRAAGSVGAARALGCALRRRPTLAPMLALAAVVSLATATSVLPAASWYGSYARGQGALSTLAYLLIAVLVLLRLRRPAQARRLGAAIALAGVAPAGYGWVQHWGRNPLPWQQPDLAARVPGTFGNPIFLGALLVVTVPLALWQLSLALRELAPLPSWRGGVRALARHLAPAVLWFAVAVLQLGALYFTKSRGPFGGLLAGLAVYGLALGRAWSLDWLRRGTLALALIAVALLLAANLLGRLGPIREGSASRLLQWTPRTSGTSDVRLEIWGPALQLIPRRPLLGCGPDALLWCYYPVYPTALRHIEAPNAVPDRTHNIFLDQAVETGLLGLAALLAVLGIAARALWRLTRSAADPARRALAAALLAALAGHAIEGCFGIPIVPTSLLTWVIAGAAGALWAMDSTSMPSTVTSAPAAPAVKARSRHRWPVAAGAAAVACLASTWLAWQVLTAGATADAADAAARNAAELEGAAQGNAGQAPMPAGVHPSAILALRQFAAAAANRRQALALASDDPAREEYLLDAGTTLVEWAQAAAQVGGPAAQQAAYLYEEALLDFGQAARLNPFNPDHFRNTGKAYERWAGLGRDPGQPRAWDQALLARAADSFARAAQLAPRHPDPLTSWAQVALWQGRPQQTLALSRRALALDGRDGDGFRMRALAELALGRRAAALADWRRALVDANLGHRGETQAQVALAEATWAHNRCDAVRDARAALSQADTPNPTQMQEIIHVDGPLCAGV